MKRIVTILLCLTLLFILPSCRTVVLPTASRIMSPKILGQTSVSKWHTRECWNDTLPKRVYYLGMRHIGKQEYFDSVKARIDSLRGEGYVVYYEGVGFYTAEDFNAEYVDTLHRKLRKVTGFHLTSHLDDDNKSIKKHYNTEKYVEQNYDFLGIHPDSSDCIHADLALPALIERYEKDKGTIMLSEYDWQTPLLAKYKWKKARVPGDTTIYNRDYLIEDMREKHLFETIRDSEQERILVVFGRGHMYRIYNMLRDSLGMKTDYARKYEAEQKAEAEAKETKRSAKKRKTRDRTPDSLTTCVND